MKGKYLVTICMQIDIYNIHMNNTRCVKIDSNNVEIRPSTILDTYKKTNIFLSELLGPSLWSIKYGTFRNMFLRSTDQHKMIKLPGCTIKFSKLTEVLKTDEKFDRADYTNFIYTM